MSWVRPTGKRRSGHAVLVAEVGELPRSLRRFGRLLVEELHDSPLAVIGIRGPEHWSEFYVIRPKLITGSAGAVSVAKLRVDPHGPTRHDLDVLRGLAWTSSKSDVENRRAIDQALDVERVTKRFFVGLNEHYGKLVAELKRLDETLPAVHNGLRRVDPKEGPERVGLRILTQTLFCYFLQRRGLLKGDPRWLTRAYNAAAKQQRRFYPEVMERLFYEWINTLETDRVDQQEAAGIPFLNGGLFERLYGDVSLPLSNELFSTDGGLLGFLDGWSFTVSEDTAEETDVAVDPEMLGKVFENLLSDEKRKKEGTIYTPRPVVQFMCREALVPWLQHEADIDELTSRLLVAGEEPFVALADQAGAQETVRIAQAADAALQEITVLDPAAGSGAFLLGMLAEIIRLRRFAHRALRDEEPSDAIVEKWKLNAIEHNLVGVDINPTAIELCRLRLWLSLLVDAPTGVAHPLPNLEYRTICADSLTDYLGGVEVQRTPNRIHQPDSGTPFAIDMPDPQRLLEARDRYFKTADPEDKRLLREELAGLENELVDDIFAKVRADAEDRLRSKVAAAQRLGRQMLDGLAPLEREFASRDRIYPLFIPAFHAPDVVARGGWDIVIMNPPYVGRRQAKRLLGDLRLLDLEQHYGERRDLMIHFGLRACELARPGGAIAVIFSDTILTSIDGDRFRAHLTDRRAQQITLHTLARTRCFEGVAVNGAVIVATVDTPVDPEVRWIENHRRPVQDLLGVSAVRSNGSSAVGETEVLETAPESYRRLPHRPLFRPSATAATVLDTYEKCAHWSEFGRLLDGRKRQDDITADWDIFSEARRLGHWRARAAARGFYDALKPGRDFVLLGCVVEGGMGIQTGDDRRFLAAIGGTVEAERAKQRQAQFAVALRPDSPASRIYTAAIANGAEPADALLLAGEGRTDDELGWSRTGLLRVAAPDAVHHGELTEQEVRDGIEDEASWLPFEKGDSSGEDGGGARWTRNNPIVIDWAPNSVALLRARAAQRSTTRKALLTNEESWGKGGVCWNGVASFLRARQTPEGSFFGHMSPTLRSTVPWLTQHALCALMNAPVSDFILRTFLGSRMHIEVMDVRRLPIPVLTDADARRFDEIGRTAVDAQREGDRDTLRHIESELMSRTSALYGIRAPEELWDVVR